LLHNSPPSVGFPLRPATNGYGPGAGPSEAFRRLRTLVLADVLVSGFGTAVQTSAGASGIACALFAGSVRQFGVVVIEGAGGLVRLFGGVVLSFHEPRVPGNEAPTQHRVVLCRLGTELS
jgi:hypothetical protein